MSTSIQPLNLADFTGGLNLRADAFQLKDNESPEMLNVDVDPRGGVRSRRGWTRWNDSEESTWSPQRLHIWDQSDGSRDVLVVNNGLIRTADAGTFSTLFDGTIDIDPGATVHGADFADWGDTLYIACGRTKTPRKWGGSGDASQLSPGETGFWNDDYTNPTSGVFPACDFVTTYQGYMVAASTKEATTEHPNRVRFSHPNQPENWATLDFIDIQGGGSHITGLVAFADHVIVFKTNSVWAIYGNTADSFTPINVTMAVGAIHRNAICLTESSAYFYSHPNGVHEYRPGDGITEVSPQLRPIIDDGELNPAALDKMFLGYINRRVWWSVPYEPDASPLPTDCRSTFVLDPSLGSWTRYTDADGDGLGPFATGGNQGDGALLLAAHRIHGYVLELEANDTALDTIDTVDAGFSSLYATRWLHADWPTLKKSWRRSDYVVTEEESEYTLAVDVMHDYDEGTPHSSHSVLVETGSTGFTWGSFVWGDGSVWGGAVKGAHVERGGAIGLAKSVQLRFRGQVGLPWGLNAVVCKFKPRKFK